MGNSSTTANATEGGPTRADAQGQVNSQLDSIIRDAHEIALSNVRHAETKATVDRENLMRQILCFRPPGSDPHRDVGELIHLPKETGDIRLLRSDPFHAVGIEGPGLHPKEPLFIVIVQPKTSISQFIGKTGPHLYGGGNCGDDIKCTELHVRPPEAGRVFNLEVCSVVSDLDYPVPRFLNSQPATSVPQDILQGVGPYDVHQLKGDYVWVEGQSILSHGRKVAESEGRPYDVFDTSYIMFVDALTGVVSPGGVDCVTKTHIPIRASHGGGTHPGQWRVGGEASFGWGGQCHMCTANKGGDCTVLIPFDILCHKPSIPADFTQ